jgi:hypothetical protein
MSAKESVEQKEKVAVAVTAVIDRSPPKSLGRLVGHLPAAR